MQDDIFFDEMNDDIFLTDDACIELAPYGSFPVGGSEATVASTMATMAETLCYRIGQYLPSRRF